MHEQSHKRTTMISLAFLLFVGCIPTDQRAQDLGVRWCKQTGVFTADMLETLDSWSEPACAPSVRDIEGLGGSDDIEIFGVVIPLSCQGTPIQAAIRVLPDNYNNERPDKYSYRKWTAKYAQKLGLQAWEPLMASYSLCRKETALGDSFFVVISRLTQNKEQIDFLGRKYEITFVEVDSLIERGPSR